MLYRCLIFILITNLIWLSLWLLAQQKHGEPWSRIGLQVIDISPVSNRMMFQHCLSGYRTTIAAEQQIAPQLAIAKMTQDDDQANHQQEKVICDPQSSINHYLVWYQYQGQQYQTLLNYPPKDYLPLAIHNDMGKGYF